MNPCLLSPPAGRRRFTLIELVTVLAIIMILASMLMPAVGKALRRARAVHCTNGCMAPWYEAIEAYADDHQDWYPCVTFWGLTDWLSPGTVGSWEASNLETFANYLDGANLKCPSRTEPRVSNSCRWPAYGGSGRDPIDYWLFFGMGNRTAAMGNWMPDGRVDFYWANAIAQGFGPVPRRNSTLRDGTPLMMDRMWTTDTVAWDNPSCDFSPNAYSCDLTPPSNPCGCGYYNGAIPGYMISNHNKSGEREGEGCGFMMLDGSTVYVLYDSGDRWDHYGYDYYNVFTVPREDVLDR